MSVRISVLSASLLLSMAGATAASAADLGGAPPEEGRYYPPYASESRESTTESYSYREEEEYSDDGDRGDAYLPPMRGERRYAEREFDRPVRGVCLPRHEIKRALRDEGWGGFHDFDRRGDTVFVQARRRTGQMYELRVDSCSGHVLRARLLDGPVYGEYARRHRGAY